MFVRELYRDLGVRRALDGSATSCRRWATRRSPTWASAIWRARRPTRITKDLWDPGRHRPGYTFTVRVSSAGYAPGHSGASRWHWVLEDLRGQHGRQRGGDMRRDDDVPVPEGMIIMTYSLHKKHRKKEIEQIHLCISVLLSLCFFPPFFLFFFAFRAKLQKNVGQVMY